MSLGDSALVRSQQPALHEGRTEMHDEGRNEMHARHEDVGGIGRGGRVDHDMIKAQGGKARVSAPAIGENSNVVGVSHPTSSSTLLLAYPIIPSSGHSPIIWYL